jgi:polygalacturonase
MTRAFIPFLLTAIVLVFAGAVAQVRAQSTASPSAESSGTFNVRDYGAVGDGQHLDSPQINQAIAACGQKGGGIVIVPAGTYLCGSIHLISHLHLVLEAGAVILGAPQEMNAYDPPEPFVGKAYQDEGHTYFHNSLIWGENLENVSVTGEGMIKGGGLTREDRPLTAGNKALVLKQCRSIIIRGVTFLHGGHFAILATGCDNLTIDGVDIDTNRDGMDLDCCRNTIVSNCRINSPTDDGLCPKSTGALGYPVITENMTITNCQVSGFKEGTLLDGTMVPARGIGRIKLGTESTGGFRNITISNCTFRGCHGLAMEEVDGGIMENITVSNIAMMDVVDYAIYITLGSRNRGPSPKPGIARNILISNVVATGIERMSGIQINGLPGDPVEGVRLQNIRMDFHGGGTAQDAARIPRELGTGYPEPSYIGIMPGYGLFARHVKDLELADIHFSTEKPDQRPALYCQDAAGLEIDHFSAPLSPNGSSPSHLDGVTGLVVRNSPCLATSPESK